ncbi:hypothetical protein [Lactobacillus amylolyticus]|mgnify:CR=1 FL=1|jgi:hypothetical protein|nr:hypothetical protein [Lactobacillus amylolyticus]
MLEENITTVAGNSKLLPLSKIVSTRKFQKIEYHSEMKIKFARNQRS